MALRAHPNRLRPEGTIGIIAPAGKVNISALHNGVALIEKMGYRVILGRHVENEHRYFAGCARDRANDFLEMMQNPEVDAVFCARGGSGSAHIIPHLDSATLPNKIFVGSSDITTLLLYLTKRGFVAFHGPMVATDLWASEKPRNNLFKILSGEAVTMHTEGIKALRHGTADGILTGGCLSLICTTIGTSYEIDTEDRILFIEDVVEPPFRIDRMLYYLKTLNKFKKIRGLVVGEMFNCQKEHLPEIILDILSEFDFPILFDFPSGHGDALFTLPFRTPVRLDTETAGLTMLAPAVS